MSDFKMKLGNFEAIPEKGDDNFATSIYEQEYDGLLIARCNQNGRYPEQARAMLDGLNGKKLALDEITALRSRAEKAEAERYQLALAICGGEDAPGYLDSVSVEALVDVARSNHSSHMNDIDRLMKAEATCEKLAAAQGRVLAIEAAAKAICQQAGTDPADAIMMLMTAAAHLFTVYSGKSSSENILHLASTLGQATVAADDFFCRSVTTGNASGPKGKTPENYRDGGADAT